MKRKWHYLCLVLVLIGFGCKVDRNGSGSQSDTISETAKNYLTAVLNIMEQNSINKYTIDWDSFKRQTFEDADGSQTTRDTYLAIRMAVSRLGDNHSFFLEPSSQQAKTSESFPQTEDDLPESSTSQSEYEIFGQRLTDEIGFIRIPAFSGSGVLAQTFAENIQQAIGEVDQASVKGWIVDLRQNLGGNMWPMMAGVGPILGNGLVGKFVDPDNNVENWYHQDGEVSIDNSLILEVSDSLQLYNVNPPVAVLTDGKTASSGEAMAVSFRGRSQTRSFGAPTYGVSTANGGFRLSDGAWLYLTVSTMADRNGTLYGEKIQPDQPVEGDFKEDPEDNDLVVNAAIQWLEGQINK